VTPQADPSLGGKSSSGLDRSTILHLFGTYGTIIVLIVMLAAFSLAEPGTFATIGNFRNILNDMAIGTIVAAG
jgi:ribose transport system permease protein